MINVDEEREMILKKYVEINDRYLDAFGHDRLDVLKSISEERYNEVLVCIYTLTKDWVERHIILNEREAILL